MHETTSNILTASKARLLVGFFLMTLPLLGFGAYQSVLSKANKVEDWLPKSYRETEELKWFRKYFRGDQFVIVSWDGCMLGDTTADQTDDPRLQALADFLMTGEANPTDAPLFAKVTTGRHIVHQLMGSPTNLKYQAAVNRLKGAIVGHDGRQTCAVITLTDRAIPRLREILGSGSTGWLRFGHQRGVLQNALERCGIEPEHAYIGGPPVDAVAIDEEGERSLYRLATLAALVGLGLAWWSLRSFALTMIVFVCGIWSAIASLAVVWITGGSTDAFLLSMPPLVYVLAVSGAVHLIKYYRDSVVQDGLTRAPVQAIVKGWKPTLLCSITTAIGLLALCSSDLTPIRKFGIYSSAGVMLMLSTLFVFLPAALYLWPIHRLKKASEETLFEDRLDRFWNTFGGWITDHFRTVTVACLVLIVLVGWGVTRTTSNVDIMKLFGEQARVRRDYRWLENNIGRLVPIELVLKFTPPSMKEDRAVGGKRGYTMLERAKITRRIHAAVNASFGKNGSDVIGLPMSAVTFLPTLPKSNTSVTSYFQQSVFDVQLQQGMSALTDSGYLAQQSDGSELWRISIRVAAFEDVDYAEFTGELRNVVEPLIDEFNAKLNGSSDSMDAQGRRSGSPISVVYTGVIPIVYKAQRALLDSLIDAAFWSFITITPLLILVSRGILPGLVAMIPNTLPILVVFGGMGWMDISVTIGSMMSASIALGVAVDDTIHYLVWFREKLTSAPNRKAASLGAYRICASPTLQAALISGLGLSVFGFSNFTSTRQFGLLMLTILVAGVIAELVMLPALLASPLGKVFEPKRRHDSKLPRSERVARDSCLPQCRKKAGRGAKSHNGTINGDTA